MHQRHTEITQKKGDEVVGVGEYLEKEIHCNIGTIGEDDWMERNVGNAAMVQGMSS